MNDRPHFWFDVRSTDRVLDHIRIAPHRIVKVVRQIMEKDKDGKQVIWHRCKFFFNEPDAKAYWESIKNYHNQGRLEVIRRAKLVGGWGCPEHMQEKPNV